MNRMAHNEPQMEITTIRVLNLAIKFLQRGWCRRHGAVRRLGWMEIPVDIHSHMANAFCAVGAVSKASRLIDRSYDRYGNQALDYLARVIEVKPIEGPFLALRYGNIMSWNDKSEREQVLSAFRQALELARSEACAAA